MAQQLSILNSKESKEVYEQLREQFGYTGKLDGALLRSEKKEKIYLFSRDLANFDTTDLRIDTMALYIAAFYKNQMRITIEGSQLIGPYCTKNVIELSKEEMQRWLSGGKLALSLLDHDPGELEDGSFLILRYGTDYLGTGRLAGELILNYLPKARFIHAIYEDMDVASEESDEE